MNSKRSNDIIAYLFACSIFLIAIAFFTINSSYALPNFKTRPLNWDISFSEPAIKGENGKTIVNNEKIDISVSLKESGETYKVYTSLDNNGDIDAVISSINLTDLSVIEVGTSNITGKTYYMSDYVSFFVEYTNNTRENNIKINTPVKVGDVLNRNTKNQIMVFVKYKDFNRMDEDQVNVFNSNIPKGVIDLDLSVKVNLVGKE